MTLGEIWEIRLEPPPDSYEAMHRRIYAELTGSGWHPGRAPNEFIPRDNPLRGTTADPLELLLAPGGAGITVLRGKDEELVLENTEQPGWLTIGSDHRFFERSAANDDIASLLRGARMPDDTTVLGDTERRWERFSDLNLKPYFAEERAVRFGFFWIDTLSTRQLDVLLRTRPASFGDLLADNGDSHVVRLWVDPYAKLGDREDWRSLAQAIGRT